MFKISQARFLQEVRTLFENASRLPELSSELRGYGYTEAKFKRLMALLEEAERLFRKKAVDYGERSQASIGFTKAWEAAQTVYSKTLKLARVAMRDDAKGVLALKLQGPRKQSFSGWCDQVITFYENMLADFGDRMKDYGYTREKLSAERALMDSVVAKYNEHSSENGAALSSTLACRLMLFELADVVSELRAVCAVAFYDKRVEMEKLGPQAPIRRHHAAKKKPVVKV